MLLLEKNIKEMTIEKDIKGLKILIVEDDEISAGLLKLFVEDLSRETLMVDNGKDAVDICIKNPDIDLILMDIRMPILDGFEATRQIRTFNPNVTIIAQTATALTGEREKTIESGCNDFITKPLFKEDLRRLILSYLHN